MTKKHSSLRPSESDAPDTSSRTLAGVACMLAGTLVFAGMDAVVKVLVAEHPVPQVLFFRSAFGLLPLAPLVWRAGGWRSLATRRPALHLIRALIGMVAISCFFVAFRELPLAQVTAIAFAAPLAMTALSVPVLKEKVGWRRWAAVAVGFVGVMVIVQPGSATLSAGIWAAVLGTGLYAVVMVLMRSMGRTESSVTTVFWFTLACSAAAACLLPWNWVQPSATGWVLFLAAGILGGSGQLLITQAVRMAPVSVVAPFDYAHIIGSISLGWLVFAELPTFHTLGGAALVAGCGLYIIHRERRARRLEKRPVAATPPPRPAPPPAPR